MSAASLTDLLSQLEGLCAKLKDAHARERLCTALPDRPQPQSRSDQHAPHVGWADVSAGSTEARNLPGSSAGGPDSQAGDAGKKDGPRSASLKDVATTLSLAGKAQSKAKHGCELRAAWDLSEQELSGLKKNRHTMATMGQRANHSCNTTMTNQTEESKSLGEKRGSWFVVRPESHYRITWNLVAMLILGYGVVLLPLDVFDPPRTAFLIVMEWLNVLYWQFDFGVSFITGYFTNAGEEELRFQKTWKQYARTWAPFDCGLLAVEWSLMVVDSVADNTPLGVARALKSARVVRAVRYLRFVRLIRIFKLQSVLEDWKTRSNSEAIVMAMTGLQVMSMVGFMAHASACIWYALGNVDRGWVHLQGLHLAPLTNRYWTSFQWSLSRLHPTNMRYMFELETAYERFFSVIATMVSLAMASVFVSLVTNQVAEIKRARHARESKMEVIRKLSMRHALSNALVMRMKAYINSAYMQQLKGSEEAEFQRILSKQMLADLKHEMWAPILRKQPYFMMVHDQYHRTMVKMCSRAVVESAAYKDDIAFATGDYGDRALFITRGSACYGHEEVIHWYDDRCIAEAALWMKWQHRENLVALEPTFFATVPERELHEVVAEHINTLIDTVAYAREFVRKASAHFDSLTDITEMESMPSLASELRSRLWASINANRVSTVLRSSGIMMGSERTTELQIVPEPPRGEGPRSPPEDRGPTLSNSLS